jgi:hypothetical protein
VTDFLKYDNERLGTMKDGEFADFFSDYLLLKDSAN